MTMLEKKRYLREIRWAKSRRAEQRGNYKKALEIHRAILADDPESYAVYLRAGWLSYKLGCFEEAICFYEQARGISNDAGPSQGIKNCRIALSDAHAAA